MHRIAKGLQNFFEMSCNMAANIDRNRQACNVGRPSLHIHSESRRFAAKALRADVQPVDAFEQLLLQLRVKRLWVPLGNRRQSACFASRAQPSKSPPIPTPTTIGGQGLPPAIRTVSTTKSTTPARPAAGVNICRRLMFSLPKPLGATVSVTFSPGTMRVCSTAGVLSPC